MALSFTTTWTIIWKCHKAVPSKHNTFVRDICITFVQHRPNVFDVGPTLYKENVIQTVCVYRLCTVWIWHKFHTIKCAWDIIPIFKKYTVFQDSHQKNFVTRYRNQIWHDNFLNIFHTIWFFRNNPFKNCRWGQFSWIKGDMLTVCAVEKYLKKYGGGGLYEFSSFIIYLFTELGSTK